MEITLDKWDTARPKVAVFGEWTFGIGDTVAEAKAIAEKVAGRRKFKRWLIYRIGERTKVEEGSGTFVTEPNDDGSYTQPRLMARVDGTKVEIVAES